MGLTGLLNENNSGLIYLTYCIMGGLGSGFAYSACLSCIQKWLPHRRGFASGIACAAFTGLCLEKRKPLVQKALPAGNGFFLFYIRVAPWYSIRGRWGV